jgi:hypothetical protein
MVENIIWLPRQGEWGGLRGYNITTHKSAKYRTYPHFLSATTARVPKSIENKQGFKLAMAQIAGETDNVIMKLMFELKVRNLGQMDNKTLISYLDVMTKTRERIGKLV